MVRLTSAGITSTSRPEYLRLLYGELRRVLGQDLALDQASPQAQIVGIIGQALYDIDRQVYGLGVANSIQSASGRRLDALVSFVGLARYPGEQSTVTVTLTGEPGTIIPLASVATTAGDGGVRFELIREVVIPASRQVNATMQAVIYGPVDAPAGTLTVPVSPVDGWTEVTNPSAAVHGRYVESDAELRVRYLNTLGRNSQGSLDGIRSRIAEVSGITAYHVRENAANTPDVVNGLTLPAHSILAIVKGGDDTEIATALANSKPAGIITGVTGVPGTATEVSETLPPDDMVIKFLRPADYPVTVSITTTIKPQFPSDGVGQMKAAVKRLIDSLGIGGSMSVNEIYAPAYSITGHTVSAIEMRHNSNIITDIASNIQTIPTVTLNNINVTTND